MLCDLVRTMLHVKKMVTMNLFIIYLFFEICFSLQKLSYTLPKVSQYKAKYIVNFSVGLKALILTHKAAFFFFFKDFA